MAIDRANELLKRVLSETGATSYYLFLGGSENYRYIIDPEYKANRSDKEKPMWLQQVREYLVTEWNAILADGVETDDLLGIYQTSIRKGEHP